MREKNQRCEMCEIDQRNFSEINSHKHKHVGNSMEKKICQKGFSHSDFLNQDRKENKGIA
jgi:hypothetical protein